MRTVNSSILLSLVTCGLSSGAQAQYSFNTGRELGIVLPALAFHGASFLLDVPTTPLWERTSSMDRERLPAFDRGAAFKWNVKAHRTSNILLLAGIGGSLALSLAERPTAGVGPPLALMGETVLFTTGLTDMVKVLAHRPRPYVYNPDAPMDIRMEREAYVSFWSGHTSTSAAMSFTCATLVQQSNASELTKTLTWTTAAVLPAVIGHYRVRAGRHFPTDVIVGYLVGVGIGLAIPNLHEVDDGLAAP